MLFAVKTYDNDIGAAAAGSAHRDVTIVLTLQNGVDSPDAVAAVVGEEPVVGGAAYIATALSAPGVIDQTGTYRRIAFGEVFEQAGAVTPRVAALHEAFVAADIQSEPAADGRVPLWEKFTYLAPFAGMTGAARQPVGVIRSRAGRARAAAGGLRRGPRARAAPKACPSPPTCSTRVLAYVDGVPESMRSSLLIDLSQGKRIEVEALQGAVVRRAALRGVPVPVMTTLYAVLRAARQVTSDECTRYESPAWMLTIAEYPVTRTRSRARSALDCDQRTTTPPRTTLRMRRVARMSASGSPLEQHEVGVLARLVSCRRAPAMPSRSAASDVADFSACAGVSPPATYSSSSRCRLAPGTTNCCAVSVPATTRPPSFT